MVRANRAVGCLCAPSQSAAAVEELVSLHDVQAYRQTRCQNSRCQFGTHPPMGASLSGIDRLAAQPFLREVLSDERSAPRVDRLLIAGVCWRNSQRGFEEREPSGRRLLLQCDTQSVSQHGNADLSVETSSGVCFGTAWTVETAGAPSVEPP